MHVTRLGNACKIQESKHMYALEALQTRLHVCSTWVHMYCPSALVARAHNRGYASWIARGISPLWCLPARQATTGAVSNGATDRSPI